MKEYKYKINGNLYKVAIGDIDNGVAEVEVNGTPYKVELEQKAATTIKVATPKPAAAPRTATGEKVIAKAVPAAAAGGTAVKAPLPGTVLDINVTVGQEVKAADTVVTLEAMKMENEIRSVTDGVVKEVFVEAGMKVGLNDRIMVIE